LKVIIFNKHDFVLRKNKRKVNDNAILFLQPEWSKQEEMTPFIVDYVMSNPKWRLFKHINTLIFLKVQIK
jgi:hypothetical protein